jgi:hypothetical protein
MNQVRAARATSAGQLRNANLYEAFGLASSEEIGEADNE